MQFEFRSSFMPFHQSAYICIFFNLLQPIILHHDFTFLTTADDAVRRSTHMRICIINLFTLHTCIFLDFASKSKMLDWMVIIRNDLLVRKKSFLLVILYVSAVIVRSSFPRLCFLFNILFMHI